MAGRPKQHTQKELIQKATEVFWSKGYTATSAQDLLKAMGIGQGSFYREFPGGKKELYQRSLQQHLENTIYRFKKEIEASENAIVFLKNFFSTMSNRSILTIENGCYFGNTLVEMSNLDDETKLISVKILDGFKEIIEEQIARAQLKGYCSKNKSAKTLALCLLNFWNGLNVTQRMHTGEKEMKEMVKMNLDELLN